MPDYFDTGFCVREPSWHGKELLLDHAPETWDEARMAAGLMWEPRLVPLYRRTVDDTGTEVYVQTDAKAVERDDTGAELGVVSNQFELLTHAEMGPIMEALLEDTACSFETAGSVRGGRQVWALIKLDEPYVVKGDRDGLGDEVLTVPYVALLNSHDGTGACKVVFTQVRVVCANTIQAADVDGDRTGLQFSFRHTSGMRDRIEDATEALRLARVEALRWQATAAELNGVTLTDVQVADFLDEWMPLPPAGTASERVVANVQRDRGRFMHLLDNSLTNSAMSRTGLGVVNAAVEYLDHVRGFQNRDTYMGRQLLRPEPLKARAVKLVRQLADA